MHNNMAILWHFLFFKQKYYSSFKQNFLQNNTIPAVKAEFSTLIILYLENKIL